VRGSGRDEEQLVRLGRVPLDELLDLERGARLVRRMGATLDSATSTPP